MTKVHKKHQTHNRRQTVSLKRQLNLGGIIHFFFEKTSSFSESKRLYITPVYFYFVFSNSRYWVWFHTKYIGDRSTRTRWKEKIWTLFSRNYRYAVGVTLIYFGYSKSWFKYLTRKRTNQQFLFLAFLNQKTFGVRFCAFWFIISE